MSHADGAVVVELGGFVNRAVLAGALLAQAEAWSSWAEGCADPQGASRWASYASLLLSVRESVWLDGSLDASGPVAIRDADQSMAVCAALMSQADVWRTVALRSADVSAAADVWNVFAAVARDLARAISLQADRCSVVAEARPWGVITRSRRHRVMTRNGIVWRDVAACPGVGRSAVVEGGGDGDA